MVVDWFLSYFVLQLVSEGLTAFQLISIVIGVSQFAVTGYLSYKVFTMNRRDLEPSNIILSDIELNSSNEGIMEVHEELDSPTTAIFDVFFKNIGRGDGELKEVEVTASKYEDGRTEEVEGCKIMNSFHSFPRRLRPNKEFKISFKSDTIREADFFNITYSSTEKEGFRRNFMSPWENYTDSEDS